MATSRVRGARTDGTTESPGGSLAFQLRAKRSEMMILELETVALRLFEEHGFANVSVEELASEAQISARTFYRYFPGKEDVLQVRIERRSEALRAALLARPPDEPLLHSLRVAYVDVLSAEDVELLRRWITVVQATPSVLKGVLGGIVLKSQGVTAEFFASRLGVPRDALIPVVLAAAAGGVLQAVFTQWYFRGGDLATAFSDALEVLEQSIGSDPSAWSRATAADQAHPPAPARRRPGPGSHARRTSGEA